MQIQQNSKQNMYLAVRDYLNKFLALLNALPNFPGLLTALINAIAQLQTAGESQVVNKSGNSAGKQQLRVKLIALTIETIRKLKAFARISKNVALESELDITESNLKRQADNLLKNTAQGIYDKAQLNIGSLAQYNVTAATQTALQTAITNFEKSISLPRLSAAETAKATRQIKGLITSTDDILKDIDALVEIIRITQPEFYQGYKTARKIVNRGGNKLALKGQVTDMHSGAGIKGAKITLVINGGNKSNSETVVKRSASKGGFNIGPAPEGTYTLTAELAGYKTSTSNVVVVKGQLTRLNITLERA